MTGVLSSYASHGMIPSRLVYNSIARDDTDANFLSSCEKELGNNSNGRYPRLISEQFPPLGTVVYEGSSRNMQCVCRTYNTMRCTIIVHMNSVEAQIVIRRLDRSSRSDLLPFYVPEASSS